MIKGVIFDMDGLLIDSEPLWMQAEIEIFKELGINLTPEDCRKMQGIKIQDVVNHWYEMHPWQGTSPEEVAKKVIKRVEQLIISQGQMQPGVIETLEFFRKKPLPMAVASSSSPELIRLVTDKLQITDYFKFLHSSLAEKRGKPYPDVFLTAARKLGIAPGHCLVFEDSINGVIAGKRAGMTVVAVPYPEHYNDQGFDIADMKLRSLLEWNEEKFRSLLVKA